MKKVLFVVLLCLFIPVSTHAYLVDTGQPETGNSSFVVGGGEGYWQSLAWMFNLSQPSVITGIQGFFYDVPYFAEAGTLTVSLYSGSVFDDAFGGPIPDVTTSVLTRTFAIDYVGHDDQSLSGWHGVDGLDLLLPPGDYWVAFGDPTDSYKGGMETGAMYYLQTAAWADYNDGVYHYGLLPVDAGVRIEGSAVPVPAAVFLLGPGLIGLAALRCRRKKWKVMSDE